MAGPATAERTEVDGAETYAHSLTTLRRMGHLTLVHSVEHPEVEASRELAFADFETAVSEMLKTDKEFRTHLDVETERRHEVIRGKVVSKAGESMVDIVSMGANAARELATKIPAYEAQAVRDECDIEVAERADVLQPGQTLWGLSMTPVKELKQHGEIYEKLGYKKELVYLQAYTKVDDKTLIARSFSVDGGTEQDWREHLAEFGLTIPSDVSTNTWLHYAVVREAGAGGAKQLISHIRDSYYAKIGSDHRRYSVSEYISRNEATVRQLFDAYYPALGDAAHTGNNNQTLRDLANQLLSTNLERLKADIRQHITRLANARTLPADTIQAADSLIRYAVVEQLRKGLPRLLAGQKSTPGLLGPGIEADNVHIVMVQNMQAGMEAGRSYAGCAYTIELLQEQFIQSTPDSTSRQEPYGGREGVGKVGIGACVVPNCPTSPRKVLVGGCGVCIGRCQKLFDQGVDPTKMAAPIKFAKTQQESSADVIDLNLLHLQKSPAAEAA